MIINQLNRFAQWAGGKIRRAGRRSGVGTALVVVCLAAAASGGPDEPAARPVAPPAARLPGGPVRAIRTMAVTVTGELLDSHCFLTAKKQGEPHRACAQTCARRGLPVMIVDQDTGQVYVIITSAPLLAPYMAQVATITGRASGGILVPERIEVKGKVIEDAEPPPPG